MQSPCRRLRRIVLFGTCILAAIVGALAIWMVLDFGREATKICTPPSDYDNSFGDRPLVEYYVHGRGIGHYARSVAIVQRLNKAGIDVRIFLNRAAIWRALHEDSENSIDYSLTTDEYDNVGGKTTAISVSSLSPTLSVFETISHVIERIMGDCEVSISSNRYPNLVVSDGDFPGMLRAEMGGIPSVGIAHGQLFWIAQKPDWVQSVPHLDAAWNSQGRLNEVSSFFSEWQIATHFCFLESRLKSGVVSRAPLRLEVLQMALTRTHARDGRLYSSVLHRKRMQEVLHLGNTTNTTRSSALLESRRKLVICYFRDHNGETVVQTLLNSGFDVLLFDSGYNKDMIHDPNRYGVKWMVSDHRRDQRVRLIGATNRTEVETSPIIARKHAHTGRNPARTERPLVDDGSRENPSDNPKRRPQDTSSGPKLIRVMDRSLFVPLMQVADGVASSAGSQLMSECIYSHMPLLALYVERDNEQKLNVELSKHRGPCHQALVFGTSFEHLEVGLEATSHQTNDNSSDSRKTRHFNLVELDRFVQEVQTSRVSQTCYQHFPFLANMTVNRPSQLDAKTIQEQDPFQSLPDAAEIILEIIKQVVPSR